MDAAPQISVLVPAYNEERFLPATLTSVHQCFTEIGLDAYEIIVCDNNSTDATAKVAAAHGARVVFEPHNQIARARNTAARAARGAWLLFLDADTLLNTALLQRTIDAFQSGKIGAGGAVVRLDGPSVTWTARCVVRLWRFLSVSGRLAAGSYLYCRRDAWEQTGGFDEDVYVTEELWFSRKLKKWCRKHRLKFHIITDATVITSARKLEWYTPSQLVRQMIQLSLPWAMKNRHNCAVWYDRPATTSPAWPEKPADCPRAPSN
jgi:glycosyltransferase involved in cell wall biosynthesis